MPPAGEAKEEHIVTYEELAASKLYSQTLPAWMPMFTPKWTILAFFIAGPIFAGIGETSSVMPMPDCSNAACVLGSARVVK